LTKFNFWVCKVVFISISTPLEATVFTRSASVARFSSCGAALQNSFKLSFAFAQLLISFTNEASIFPEYSGLVLSSVAIDLLAAVFLLRTFNTVATAGRT
jgi:hypothetical protein